MFMNRVVQKGLTLVEVLVAVAIIGIVLAIAEPSLSALMERRRVVAAAGEIASMFASARSEANVVSGKVNMHFEPVTQSSLDFSCVRLSVAPGTQDRCSCDKPLAEACSGGTARLLREYILPRNTSVTFFTTDATVWGSRPYVAAFERGKFLDVQDLQVVVQGTNTGAQLRVEYNNAGRVRICSPGAVVGGFQSCG